MLQLASIWRAKEQCRLKLKRHVGNFSPVKWSILATEGASWRGFGASEMMLPIAVLVLVGAVGYLIGVLVLRRSDR